LPEAWASGGVKLPNMARILPIVAPIIDMAGPDLVRSADLIER
jgi:hypothetical protein